MNKQKILLVAVGLVLGIVVGGVTAAWATSKLCDSMLDGFEGQEYHMTQLEMMELKHVEAGDYANAMNLMVDRIFVGLTRLHDEQDSLLASYRAELPSLVCQFAGVRQRHPEFFDDKPDWWTCRIDTWVEIQDVF